MLNLVILALLVDCRTIHLFFLLALDLVLLLLYGMMEILRGVLLPLWLLG